MAACNQVCPYNTFNGCRAKEYNAVCHLSNMVSVVTPQPITNADRIRSMSDEELCEFLSQYKFCDICAEGCDNCKYHGDCDERLLEWLQQPAEDCDK